MFNGDWGSDDTKKIFGADGALKTNIYHDVNGDDMTFGNKVMKTIGLAASVYTLGTTPVKSYAGAQKIITVTPGDNNF